MTDPAQNNVVRCSVQLTTTTYRSCPRTSPTVARTGFWLFLFRSQGATRGTLPYGRRCHASARGPLREAELRPPITGRQRNCLSRYLVSVGVSPPRRGLTLARLAPLSIRRTDVPGSAKDRRAPDRPDDRANGRLGGERRRPAGRAGCVDSVRGRGAPSRTTTRRANQRVRFTFRTAGGVANPLLNEVDPGTAKRHGHATASP